MDKLEGLDFWLIRDGEPVKPRRKDGFVGYLKPYEKVNVEIHTLRDDVFGFNVDGSKNVNPKHNESDEKGKLGKFYSFTVNIKKSDAGVPHTEYYENNIHLAVKGREGAVSIWIVTLVSQKGWFFLTQQKIYDFCCYKEGNSVRCPRFEENGNDKCWPQLVSFLEEIFDLGELHDIDCYQPRNNDIILNGEPGRVMWFNIARGYGLIKTREGVLRVHWTQIETGERLRYLEPNQKVDYRGKKSGKNEAVGVKPIYEI